MQQSENSLDLEKAKRVKSANMSALFSLLSFIPFGFIFFPLAILNFIFAIIGIVCGVKTRKNIFKFGLFLGEFGIATGLLSIVFYQTTMFFLY